MNTKPVIIIFSFLLVAAIVAVFSHRRSTIVFPFTEPISNATSPDSSFDAYFLGTQAAVDSPYIFHLFLTSRQDTGSHRVEILTMIKPKEFSYGWKRGSNEIFIRYKTMTVRQYRRSAHVADAKPEVPVIFIPPLDSLSVH